MDGSPKASYEIVTHNYGPFNAAVSKYIQKLEQPDPRAASEAFREKARGVGYVLAALGVLALLTLIGVSLVVWQSREPTRITEGAGVPPKWPTGVAEPRPPSGPEKVVTNYTLFTTVRVVEGVDIVTGWNFGKSTDDKPEFQYCHLRTPDELGNRLIGIAQRSQSGALIWQASPSTFNGIAREIDYETALSKCRWF